MLAPTVYPIGPRELRTALEYPVLSPPNLDHLLDQFLI